MEPKIHRVGSLSGDQVRAALVAATRAPSLHNSQPWRFRCTQTAIELFADASRTLPVADPDGRETVLACGAALMNLRLAIRGYGVYPDVRPRPDIRHKHLMAVVYPRNSSTIIPAEQHLARAIPLRSTNRRPFLDGPINEPVRHRLRQAAEIEQAWLAIIPPHQWARVRALAREAHELQQREPAFVTEWTHWTGRETGHADGVPATSRGPLPEPHDQWAMRDFSGGHARPRVPGKDFEAQPLIAVIGSFHDLPLARLQAGQAMQRVLLTAVTAGLSASFLSQLVEVPTVREKLRELIGGGLWPQAVLRIGYGTPVPPTPRRDIADVLCEGDAQEDPRIRPSAHAHSS
jgi:nitroreductase